MNARIFEANASKVFRGPGVETRCTVGKAGVIPAEEKREGDNKSPLGDWPMRSVFYRPDRVSPPETHLPVSPLTPHDGWCDDPKADVLYNRHVLLPSPWSCEKLWREDHVYDLIVVLGHNDDPPVAGLGSAIFMHLVRPDFSGTEGCVALEEYDLRRVLSQSRSGDVVRIVE